MHIAHGQHAYRDIPVKRREGEFECVNGEIEVVVAVAAMLPLLHACLPIIST